MIIEITGPKLGERQEGFVASVVSYIKTVIYNSKVERPQSPIADIKTFMVFYHEATSQGVFNNSPKKDVAVVKFVSQNQNSIFYSHFRSGIIKYIKRKFSQIGFSDILILIRREGEEGEYLSENYDPPSDLAD
jgi:hypothetical protein